MNEPVTFERVWIDALTIDGMLTKSQGATLYELAVNAPTQTSIVEIGSHHGRSTSILARGSLQTVGLQAVDIFDDPRWGGGPESLARFDANLSRLGVRDRITLFRGTSADAAPEWSGPISVLFVDGAHDYQSVLIDIDGWVKHVVPGGKIAFHDAYSALGVTQAIFRRLFFSSGFAYVGSTGTLAIFERRDATVAERIRSSARMIARLPYQGRNLLIKVGIKKQWPWMHKAMGHPTATMPY